jgi:hypothetical protein
LALPARAQVPTQYVFDQLKDTASSFVESDGSRGFVLTETVVPWIALQRAGGEQVAAHTFKIYGLTESKLDDLVKPVKLGPRITVWRVEDIRALIENRSHDPQPPR